MTTYWGSLILLAAAQAGQGNLIQYIRQSNTAGQVIIYILLVCSMVAWTVMIGKHIELKHVRRQNRAFEKALVQSQSLLNLDAELFKAHSCPYATLVKKASEAYQRSGSISMVENSLHRGVAETCLAYESKMVLLGSIINGAPFLGLLGTVWGVMDAFGAMGTESNVTLAMLAPGVSGALTTTIAGLVVAIPSVFGYNFLLTHTRIMVTDVENFASLLADRLEIEAKARSAK